MSIRIIAGELKGRRLKTLPGSVTRPTADRLREAVFNILSLHVRQSTVLELFAGTGALGIEALSRGAAYAVFIDNAKKACEIIFENLLTCRMETRATVIRWDIEHNLNCLSSLDPTFDLVFMDPPYNQNMVAPVLNHLRQSKKLQKNARIIVEHHEREPLLEDIGPFECIDQRRYGKTIVSFLKYMV